MSCTEDGQRFCRFVGTHLGDVVLAKRVSSLNVLLGYCRLCLVCSSIRFLLIGLGLGLIDQLILMGFFQLVDHWHSFHLLVCESSVRYI